MVALNVDAQHIASITTVILDGEAVVVVRITNVEGGILSGGSTRKSDAAQLRSLGISLDEDGHSWLAGLAPEELGKIVTEGNVDILERIIHPWYLRIPALG